MKIERAKPEHAATLTGIAFAAKRHWGYPERWITQWTDLLTIKPESIGEQETYIASVDGEAVGFYSLRSGMGGMCLEHLWVLPRAMGRGVGRALFEHAVEQGKALGSGTLEIESDPNAAGFYERMGARQVTTTVTELDGKVRELPVLVYELT